MTILKNSDISTDNGSITLDIENSVYQNADILAINGDINVTSNSGSILMGDGSETRLSNSAGTITYLANNDILLSKLNTDGNIVLNATLGSISDNSSSEEANITANNFEVTTITGFGTSTEDIDLDVNIVTITNTLSGGIYIDEKDDLYVNSLNAINQHITVKVGNNLIDGKGTENSNITSKTLTIISEKSIGSQDDDFNVDAQTILNITALTNDIYISTNDSVYIGSINAANIAVLNVNGSLIDALEEKKLILRQII